MVRQDKVKAWVSIMYGCNNFCSYCIVPYVRGRSAPEAGGHLNEVRELVAEGYKDITLLGQNVNSYGKDLEEPMDFADLLEQVNNLPGDFLIRFMTSHPKDATQKLFETMARCEKVAPGAPPALPGGERPGAEGDEPEAHHCPVPGQDPRSAGPHSGYRAHLRRDRGLPRGDHPRV